MAEETGAVGGDDQVPAPETCILGRTVRENARHHRSHRREDAKLAEVLPSKAVVFLGDGLHLDDPFRAVPLESHGDQRGGTRGDVPGNAVTHAPQAGDPRDGVPVDRQDPVAGEQTRLGGGAILHDIADHVRRLGLADGTADAPDDTGEKKGQPQACGGTRRGHEDLV